jgi:hypothetical protein
MLGLETGCSARIRQRAQLREFWSQRAFRRIRGSIAQCGSSRTYAIAGSTRTGGPGRGQSGPRTGNAEVTQPTESKDLPVITVKSPQRTQRLARSVGSSLEAHPHLRLPVWPRRGRWPLEDFRVTGTGTLNLASEEKLRGLHVLVLSDFGSRGSRGRFRNAADQNRHKTGVPPDFCAEPENGSIDTDGSARAKAAQPPNSGVHRCGR